MNLVRRRLPPGPTTVGPNHNWTPRWVELRPHLEQLRLWDDETRFKVVPAGRRSGKTEFAKRRLVEHLFRKTWHGQPGRYFAAAPTHDQAKRIFWEDLKALLPRYWIGSISETDLRIVTTRGAQLWVHGLEVPQRIEGSPWDGCVIDELANCRPKIWDAHVRPALADRRGWAWLIGVPDMDSPGQMDYENLALIAQSGAEAEWACFSWPSADVLPADEIESARRLLDPVIFEQEYLGKFVIARGRAFANFDPVIHVKRTVYDPSLRVCWSLDFNIDPMCSGVIQHNGAEVRVIDEISLPDTDTNSACDAFLERAGGRGWDLKNITIYGDATGWARDSTSGKSDWAIVLRRLHNLSPRFKVPRSNPAVKDTINAVRAMLRSADGGPRISIDPRCARLIQDLRTAVWPGDIEDQYALSWLRYFIDWEYPIALPAPASAGPVGFSKLQREI
jgi:hypothetical protein